MKCGNCGGRLTGDLTVCPFCDTRRDIDLAQMHFRNLGSEENLPCPGCASAMEVIEFDSDPPVRVERCVSCFGLFFNPGELVVLLESAPSRALWVDGGQLKGIAEQFDHIIPESYRHCPVCAESMNKTNFARRSGVLIDSCREHGVWLQGGELRRLMEWWRAGGSILHMRHELEKARFGPGMPVGPKGKVTRKRPEDIKLPEHWDEPGPVSWLIWQIVTAIFD